MRKSTRLKAPDLLWLYGFVRYRDFFPNTHNVGFCAYLEITRAPGMSHMIWRFRFIDGEGRSPTATHTTATAPNQQTRR